MSNEVPQLGDESVESFPSNYGSNDDSLDAALDIGCSDHDDMNDSNDYTGEMAEYVGPPSSGSGNLYDEMNSGAPSGGFQSGYSIQSLLGSNCNQQQGVGMMPDNVPQQGAPNANSRPGGPGSMDQSQLRGMPSPMYSDSGTYHNTDYLHKQTTGGHLSQRNYPHSSMFNNAGPMPQYQSQMAQGMNYGRMAGSPSFPNKPSQFDMHRGSPYSMMQHSPYSDMLQSGSPYHEQMRRQSPHGSPSQSLTNSSRTDKQGSRSNSAQEGKFEQRDLEKRTGQSERDSLQNSNLSRSSSPHIGSNSRPVSHSGHPNSPLSASQPPSHRSESRSSQGAGSRPPSQGAGSRPPSQGAGSRPPSQGAGSRPPSQGAGSRPSSRGSESEPAGQTLDSQTSSDRPTEPLDQPQSLTQASFLQEGKAAEQSSEAHDDLKSKRTEWDQNSCQQSSPQPPQTSQTTIPNTNTSSQSSNKESSLPQCAETGDPPKKKQLQSKPDESRVEDVQCVSDVSVPSDAECDIAKPSSSVAGAHQMSPSSQEEGDDEDDGKEGQDDSEVMLVTSGEDDGKLQNATDRLSQILKDKLDHESYNQTQDVDDPDYVADKSGDEAESEDESMEDEMSNSDEEMSDASDASDVILSSNDEDVDEDGPLASLAEERPPSDEEVVDADVSGSDTNMEPETIELDSSIDDINKTLADKTMTAGVESTGEGDKKKKKKKLIKKKSDKTAGDKSKKGKKRKAKTGDDEKIPKKRRRRKKKGEKSTDSGDDLDKKHRTQFERRNIRKIMGEDELEAETVAAQQEEMERKRRLQELHERFKAEHLEEKNRKRSELLALLEEAEASDDDVSATVSLDEKKIEKSVPTVSGALADVIDISSSDEENDVVMLPSDLEDDEDEEDASNSGSHTNDAMNQPDIEGRVLVNVGHPLQEPDIFLAPQLAQAVKPHQIGGIRFLFDNLVESLERYKTSNGFGCILAHSMGLGKTIQIVCFADIFLRYTGASTVLIIVPVNTLQNWVSEFNHWLPPPEMISPDVPQDQVLPRSFPLHVVTDTVKTNAGRAKVISDWKEKGGVLLLGYEMYRLLTSRKLTANRRKPRSKAAQAAAAAAAAANPDGKVVIDLEEEDKMKELAGKLQEALVRPGPDLVICDEGHRIKNSHASISQALKNIRTKRRVVLTGYPLQNNLMEYWCMVDFVRPNFLGNKTEFSNMFERPIMNGQCADSTPQDMRLMRFRSHVLHSLLEGFVQRRGHTVLKLALPEKEEHVLLIRMSPIQRKLYKAFMDDIAESGMQAWATSNPIKAFSVCCKIWNHPDILHDVVDKKMNSADADDDLDIDDAVEGPGAKGAKGGAKAAAGKKGAKTPGATDPPMMGAPGGNMQPWNRGMGPGGMNPNMPPASGMQNQGPFGMNQPMGMHNQGFGPKGMGPGMQNQFGQNPNGPNMPNPNMGMGNQGYGPTQSMAPGMHHQGYGQNQDFGANQGMNNQGFNDFGSDQGFGMGPQTTGMQNQSFGQHQGMNMGMPNDRYGPSQGSMSQGMGQNQDSNQAMQSLGFGNNQNSGPNQSNQDIGAGMQNDSFGQNQNMGPNQGMNPDMQNQGFDRNQGFPSGPNQQNQRMGGQGFNQNQDMDRQNMGTDTMQKQGMGSDQQNQGMGLNSQNDKFGPNQGAGNLKNQTFGPNQNMDPSQQNPDFSSMGMGQQGQGKGYNQPGQEFQQNNMNHGFGPNQGMGNMQNQGFHQNQGSNFGNFGDNQQFGSGSGMMGGSQNTGYNMNQGMGGAQQNQGMFGNQNMGIGMNLTGQSRGPDMSSLSNASPMTPSSSFSNSGMGMGPGMSPASAMSSDSNQDMSFCTPEAKAMRSGSNSMNSDMGIPVPSSFSNFPQQSNMNSPGQGMPPYSSSGVKNEFGFGGSMSNSGPSSMSNMMSNLGIKNEPNCNLKSEPGSTPSSAPNSAPATPRSDVKTEKDGSISSVKEESKDDVLTDMKKEQQMISYEWAYEIMKEYQRGVIENSGKMVILMSLIEETLRVDDKALIFSQSLFTLNLIEEYLGRTQVPPGSDCSAYPEYWAKNRNYFRLDGSTSAMDREKLINQFNAPDSRIKLFMLSTRAGCLGINLVGANRVIVLDASWNPCHDCQAVCRVYRYGQRKPCYVYRLVSDITMEKKIYDRQINKQGMSDRVVDELQPQTNFTKRQVDSLLHFEDTEAPYVDPRSCDRNDEDAVLTTVLKKHHKWLTKVPFTHESLLIDRKDQKLTKTEKRLAKQGYEMEKKMATVSYSRPSYVTFYPRGVAINGPRGPMIRAPTVIGGKRPIASVRPMMSTPIPLNARGIGVGGQRQVHTTIPISSLLRPGVSVHQVQTTTAITIPGTTTSSSSVSRIPAGETVLVIKTPKGVYIRTNHGKIFAVRSAPKTGDESPPGTSAGASTSTTAATTTVTSVLSGPKPLTVPDLTKLPKLNTTLPLAPGAPRIVRVVTPAMSKVGGQFVRGPGGILTITRPPTIVSSTGKPLPTMVGTKQLPMIVTAKPMAKTIAARSVANISPSALPTYSLDKLVSKTSQVISKVKGMDKLGEVSSGDSSEDSKDGEDRSQDVLRTIGHLLAKEKGGAKVASSLEQLLAQQKHKYKVGEKDKSATGASKQTIESLLLSGTKPALTSDKDRLADSRTDSTSEKKDTSQESPLVQNTDSKSSSSSLDNISDSSKETRSDKQQSLLPPNWKSITLKAQDETMSSKPLDGKPDLQPAKFQNSPALHNLSSSSMIDIKQRPSQLGVSGSQFESASDEKSSPEENRTSDGDTANKNKPVPPTGNDGKMDNMAVVDGRHQQPQFSNQLSKSMMTQNQFGTQGARVDNSHTQNPGQVMQGQFGGSQGQMPGNQGPMSGGNQGQFVGNQGQMSGDLPTQGPVPGMQNNPGQFGPQGNQGNLPAPQGNQNSMGQQFGNMPGQSSYGQQGQFSGPPGQSFSQQGQFGASHSQSMNPMQNQSGGFGGPSWQQQANMPVSPMNMPPVQPRDHQGRFGPKMGGDNIPPLAGMDKPKKPSKPRKPRPSRSKKANEGMAPMGDIWRNMPVDPMQPNMYKNMGEPNNMSHYNAGGASNYSGYMGGYGGQGGPGGYPGQSMGYSGSQNMPGNFPDQRPDGGYSGQDRFSDQGNVGFGKQTGMGSYHSTDNPNDFSQNNMGAPSRIDPVGMGHTGNTRPGSNPTNMDGSQVQQGSAGYSSQGGVGGGSSVQQGNMGGAPSQQTSMNAPPNNAAGDFSSPPHQTASSQPSMSSFPSPMANPTSMAPGMGASFTDQAGNNRFNAPSSQTSNMAGDFQNQDKHTSFSSKSDKSGAAAGDNIHKSQSRYSSNPTSVSSPSTGTDAKAPGSQSGSDKHSDGLHSSSKASRSKSDSSSKPIPTSQTSSANSSEVQSGGKSGDIGSGLSAFSSPGSTVSSGMPANNPTTQSTPGGAGMGAYGSQSGMGGYGSGYGGMGGSSLGHYPPPPPPMPYGGSSMFGAPSPWSYGSGMWPSTSGMPASSMYPSYPGLDSKPDLPPPVSSSGMYGGPDMRGGDPYSSYPPYMSPYSSPYGMSPSMYGMPPATHPYQPANPLPPPSLHVPNSSLTDDLPDIFDLDTPTNP